MGDKIQAPKVEKPEELTHINVIIYGDSGVGKTQLAGTAQDCEETSPVLYIDLEGGTRTLAGKDVDVTRPQNFEIIQEVYDYLLHANDKYKCVVIDSLTELQKKYSLGVIMGDIDQGEFGYVDLVQSVAPTRQDWLRTGGQMAKLIRSFRDLAYHPVMERRVHVIMTALENMNEKKGMAHPQLSGVLGTDCGAMVDFLWRLARVNQVDAEGNISAKRYLLTDDYINEEGIKFLGKSRKGEGRTMPKGFWNPTISEIIKHI